MVRRGLVLGGGGVAGIAWELGLLAGLAEHGVDVAEADLVVGTSAGSVVGTVLRQGRLLDAFRLQAAPAEVEDDPGMSGFDFAELVAVLTRAGQTTTNEQDARAAVGEYARTAPAAGIPEAARLARIGGLLPSPEWPDGELRVTTVDALDGSFGVHDSASGVPLPVAVTASCAVPGTGPTITVAGRPAMDGGMRSATNADVAADCDRVLVVACLPEGAWSPLGPSLPQAVATLRQSAEVFVVEADEASRTAFGANFLSAGVRAASAAAGHAQAATVAAEVRAFWGGDAR
jgi:NTE family protein